MIHSFRDQLTEDIFDGKTVRKIDKKLAKRARMRLQLLNAAVRINDLYFPSYNKFHALKGFISNCCAIIVNKQWRISFEWEDNHPVEVQFEDYH